MRSLILFIFLCGSLAAQQAGIEGTVIDAVTRQPMPGVHITMRMADDAYGAMSGRDGHFSIAGMKPGLYFLTAQRNGYVHLPGKTGMMREDENVVLKAGEQLAGFTVELTPRAVIAGRVLDEYGDPVQHAEVEAVPVASGVQMFERFGMNDRTDERGQFRLTGPPGKFHVKATAPDVARRLILRDIRSDGLPPAVYGTTWYPGSENKDQASVVEVTAGHDVTDIDFHLARKRSLTISGVVTGMPVQSVPLPLFVYVRSSDLTTQVIPVASPDGKFTASGLAPGSYHLFAIQESASGPLRSQSVEVRLDSADESSVNLALVRGEELSGTLEIEGDPPKTALPEGLVVRLDSHQNYQPKAGEVARDGSFRIEQVFPEKFSLRVLPLPENAYIKSPDGALDLSRGVGGSKIKITISRNGGQVEGAVLDDDGKPLNSPLAFVALAASADDIGNDSLQSVEAGAKFTFKGLRPGKYRLLAVDPRRWSGETAALKALFPKAPEVEVREGDRITRDAKVIATDIPSAQQ